MRKIWVNGTETDWDLAQVHVWDEVAIRGVSVFEGILCVWRDELNRHMAVGLRQHFRRLQRSASLLDIAMPFGRSELDDVLASASKPFTGTDFYVRPTVFAKRGRSSRAADAETQWFVGAFPVEQKSSSDLLSAAVAWPSRTGSHVPPGAKTGGSYLDFRIVERTRDQLGADVGLLVDPAGNLVEADGSGLLVIDDGEVIAPLVSGHALDSITRRILIQCAEEAGFKVAHRPVHWSDAHGATLLLGGTLAGVRTASLRESLMAPSASDLRIANQLREAYGELLARSVDSCWLEAVGEA